MKATGTITGVAVAAIILLLPPIGFADFYDSFDDGFYRRDPNDPRYDANDPCWTDPNNAVNWDKDNPDWTIFTLVASSPIAKVFSDTVADNAVRLATDSLWTFPFASMAIVVESGDHDPNTSPTWWDDTTDHYMLAWVYYTGYIPNGPNAPPYSFNDPRYDPNDDDPNDDCGRAMMLMHTNPGEWNGLVFIMDFDAQVGGPDPNYHDEYPHSYHLNLQSFNFDNFPDTSRLSVNFRRVWIEPNHPNWADYPNLPYGVCPRVRPVNESINPYNGPNFQGQNIDNWERSGFWMLFQFVHDPNYSSGDPNGKWTKGAIWHGDKYDWDGKYVLAGEWSTTFGGPSINDPNFYWPEGACYFLANSDNMYAGGFPADVAYDNIEVRTGIFTKDPKRLDLAVVNPQYGLIVIDPEMVDPNDPNTANDRLLRYTEGTEVALLAEPIEGKSFKGWRFFDPNHPGDANYGATDANHVIYLTMDRDYEIEAAFKCGTSLPPFVAMTLMAMAVGVAVRRYL
ncbi:MAG: hypothetical protein JXQ73_28860 [Phycisphaerae bacterium]|nr:hypothetical protein [Phycisphaerae bacterium]